LPHHLHDASADDEPSLDIELLEQTRRVVRDTTEETTPDPLAVEVTIHAADTASATQLRQRQLDAIIRRLRHAVDSDLLR